MPSCCIAMIPAKNRTEPNAWSAEYIMCRFQFKAMHVQVLSAPSQSLTKFSYVQFSVHQAPKAKVIIRQRFWNAITWDHWIGDFQSPRWLKDLRVKWRQGRGQRRTTWTLETVPVQNHKHKQLRRYINNPAHTNITSPPSGQINTCMELAAWEVKNSTTLAVSVI